MATPVVSAGHTCVVFHAGNRRTLLVLRASQIRGAAMKDKTLTVDDEERGLLRDAEGEPMLFKSLEEVEAVVRVLKEAWKKKQRALGLSDELDVPKVN